LFQNAFLQVIDNQCFINPFRKRLMNSFKINYLSKEQKIIL
jgi:hypothetical protein